MAKYRIYIDETGNADLDSSDNPNHRFLSLSGVIMDLDYAGRTLHPEMEILKQEFFEHHPDDPIVFHRKEMVNRLGRFGVLKEPEIEARFNERLLDRLAAWEYTLITVIMDKKEHRDKYKVWKSDPYHYCLSVMLERYLYFLERCGAKGDVMIESRGTAYDQRLAKSFRRLWEEGSEFLQAERLQQHLTSREIKIRGKQANIAGLQLADLVAHPSRRDAMARFELDGGKDDRARPFGTRIIAILENKYMRYKGRLMGSGLKKLP